jgi:hypothetical protein
VGRKLDLQPIYTATFSLLNNLKIIPLSPIFLVLFFLETETFPVSVACRTGWQGHSTCTWPAEVAAHHDQLGEGPTPLPSACMLTCESSGKSSITVTFLSLVSQKKAITLQS